VHQFENLIFPKPFLKKKFLQICHYQTCPLAIQRITWGRWTRSFVAVVILGMNVLQVMWNVKSCIIKVLNINFYKSVFQIAEEKLNLLVNQHMDTLAKSHFQPL
jgi:hypothetical protein